MLDFAGNVRRHGPIDQIEPPRARKKGGPREASNDAITKSCPECLEIVANIASICPACGHEFDAPKHAATADDVPVLSREEPPEEHKVRSLEYAVHHKRDGGPDAPRTLRVDYLVDLGIRISEWVCVEHSGFAREKAAAWWGARSYDPFPENAEHAVMIAEAGGLAVPETITTKRDGRWSRVIGAKGGEKPPPTFLLPLEEEEIPF